MSEDKDTINLQELLKKLLIDNNTSFTPSQKQKKFEEYKFWKTQPVSKFDESFENEGPIDTSQNPEDIPNNPYPLLDEFEWTTMDITEPTQLEDIFLLLNENYVEDRDSTFRFNYSREFFNWALKPPGWKRDWHVGVRVKNTNRLIAFISAIPVTLQVRGQKIKSVEINFLCIHKKLRSKRLAPILIKEITRRVNKANIWQALYSAGTLLPSPISTCRYSHKPLNWPKLFEVGFTALPSGATNSQMIAKYALPKKTTIPGLRLMKYEDIDKAFDLFIKYQSRFDIIQVFDKSEFKHWFLSGEGVIYSYVVEINNNITDFVSFYSLPFTILKNPVYEDLGVGYLFYYASDADFAFKDRFDLHGSKLLKKRLLSLINDASILAYNLKMDVFNALTSQDNCLFLEDLKFGPGDGFLNFYLFNYRAFPISGGLKDDKKFDIENRSNVGIVML